MDTDVNVPFKSSLPIAFEPALHPETECVHWILWAEGQETITSDSSALCGEDIGEWDHYPIWPVDKGNWCIQCLQHLLISLTGKNL